MRTVVTSAVKNLIVRNAAITRGGSCCALFLLFTAIGTAQENPAVAEVVIMPEAAVHQAAEADTETDFDRLSEASRDARRRKSATIALAALGGIAILGVGAIAIIMLWARRLRRLARDLGPQQKTAGNDFWFLKPPKPIASESQLEEIHRPLHPPSSESDE